MPSKPKGPDPSDFLGGTLNILGLKIDLGELLGSPEELKSRLEELREKLRAAGGKEAQSGEAWQKSAATISGHIRTSGLLGEREFHIGTTGKPSHDNAGRRWPAPEPAESSEPPIDVFYEGPQVTIVADVPGVSLEDMDLTVDDKTFSLVIKATARRSYERKLVLEAEVEPRILQATCNNGVLEVRLQKRESKG